MNNKEMNYLKGRIPHPATVVNNLGPKSRAGLFAQPQFIQYVILIANISSPMHNGFSPFGGFKFRSSVMADTQTINSAAPNI